MEEEEQIIDQQLNNQQEIQKEDQPDPEIKYVNKSLLNHLEIEAVDKGIYQILKDNFITIGSGKSANWYFYNEKDGCWVSDSSKIEIRKAINSLVTDEYESLASHVTEEKIEDYRNIVNKINKIVRKCKGQKIGNLIDCCSQHFKINGQFFLQKQLDKKIEEYINNHPELFNSTKSTESTTSKSTNSIESIQSNSYEEDGDKYLFSRLLDDLKNTDIYHQAIENLSLPINQQKRISEEWRHTIQLCVKIKQDMVQKEGEQFKELWKELQESSTWAQIMIDGYLVQML